MSVSGQSKKYLFPKKILLCGLALCLFLTGCTPENSPSADVCATAATISYPAFVSVNPGELSARAAVLLDAQSGQLLYAKNADTRLPMASTTKIMTALCAVTLADPEAVVTVSAEAVGVEGSSVYLVAGEQLTLEQLLYALLLESANDAAVAIALHVSGSIPAFAEEMNRMAANLGLKDTHFVTPHGLDAEEHYTTAYELARITRAALEEPLLARIFATRHITIPLKGTEGTRYLQNHNRLLKTYTGCIGVKTGFTRHSGRCLCTAATRDGVTLIAVTLDAPDDWNDHTRLLDAGFTALESVTLTDTVSSAFFLPVTGGKEAVCRVTCAQSVTLALPRDRGTMRCTVSLPHFLYAPVEAGTVVGSLQFFCDTDRDGEAELLATVPLLTSCEVEQKEYNGFPKRLWERVTALFKIKRQSNP